MVLRHSFSLGLSLSGEAFIKERKFLLTSLLFSLALSFKKRKFSLAVETVPTSDAADGHIEYCGGKSMEFLF